MLKLIDAHAHLNFPDYDADREAVLTRAAEAGIGLINVGTGLETSRQVVDLAQGRENTWATIGLHPTDAAETGESGEALAELRRLAQEPKVVAIGECGLDYFRADPSTAAKQQEMFVRQIEIANEAGKPLMLHIRNAYQDAYEILKTHAKVKGDTHFFAGTWDEAKLFLDLGFTLSFTGVITFARSYDEVIKNAPLDMILAETDCPYVAPIPHRGKRNEPAYVQEVVKKLAEIKGLSDEAVAAATLANTKRVFGLDIA